MSVYTTTRLTDPSVTIAALKIPSGGSGKVFMFNAVRGQLAEPCVVKVDSAKGNPGEAKKTLEKRSKNLAQNLLIMAQLYRVAAKRLCRIRVLNTAEVDNLRIAVANDTTLTQEGRDDFQNRYNDGTTGYQGAVAPQVWFLMEKVKVLQDFGLADTKGRLGLDGLPWASWLRDWRVWARKALEKKDAWADLGRIALVDMFVGNNDRFNMWVGPPARDPDSTIVVKDKVVGHPGNVLIGEDGPVGLDFFDPFSGESSWDLYHEYKTLNKNWYGYFLCEPIPDTANYAKKWLRQMSVAARKNDFALRVVNELMRLSDLKADPAKAKTQFMDGMQYAAGDLQFWVQKTSKKFCKDIGVPVPKGLAERSRLILGT